jgi:RNA polymerase sigma-70 factor (ECF subfamily)
MGCSDSRFQVKFAHDIDQMATETWFDTEETLRADFRDDMLKMLFICCHPIVSRESQIALALKTLFGFSSEEISRAFLTPKTTIDQRIVRAKKTIRENNLSFDLPSGEELSQRLSVVLNVLYLIFNEGYAATSGDQLVKEDLCAEASRLALLLGKHPVAKQPRTFALVALFLLQSSRFGTRLDQENEIQLLKDQDRSKWDQELIRRGLAALELAAYGEELSKFHLEAGIAASHAIAKTYDQTNWGVIVSYYDDLIAMDSSPIIALNRAVAIFKRDGAEAGLLAIEPLKANKKLQSYFLFHATLGEFLAEAQQPGAAIGSFEMALRHANTEPEKRFITKRMGEVNTNDA